MKTFARIVIPTLVAAILLSCPSTGWAQSASTPTPWGLRVGEQLVVTYMTDPFGPSTQNFRRTVYMDFLMIDGGRLVGRDGDRTFVIDAASIRTVKRRVGTKPASAPAMAFGSAAGFAAGFLVGAVMHSENLNGDGQTAANRGLSTGVLVGAPLGAFAAWVVSRSRPIYEAVQIGRARPSVVMDLSGRVGLTVSVLTP